MRPRILAVSLLLSLAIFPAPFAAAQRRFPLPTQQERPHIDEQEANRQRDQANKLNAERQEALKRDTEKLLQLSTELKDYVGKSNENMLSMDVIKKAEQIEKLAHSVKEKMKGSF